MSMIRAFPDQADFANVDALLAGRTTAARISGTGQPAPLWRGRNPGWSLGQLNAFAARIIDAHYAGAGTGCFEGQVADLFASHDRCEVLFCFSAEPSLTDGLIHSNGILRGAPGLLITRALQFALCSLGYRVNEFRKASRNVNAAQEYLQRGARLRRAPIVGWDRLNALIDNTASPAFVFCLHALVPITDLIGLDLGRPVTLQGCRVATLDPQTAAFAHVEADGPVTVRYGEGRFLSGGHLRLSPLQAGLLDQAACEASVSNRTAAA